MFSHGRKELRCGAKYATPTVRSRSMLEITVIPRLNHPQAMPATSARHATTPAAMARPMPRRGVVSLLLAFMTLFWGGALCIRLRDC